MPVGRNKVWKRFLRAFGENFTLIGCVIGHEMSNATDVVTLSPEHTTIVVARHVGNGITLMGRLPPTRFFEMR